MKNSITIIGAGLAGSLLGIYLARKNFQVELYERRPDTRTAEIGGRGSTTLVLSVRGLHALEETAISDKIMRIAIGMRGKMIHAVEGVPAFQLFGNDESDILYATSQSDLNDALMTAAEKHKNLHINFNMRCTGMNFETGEVDFHNEETRETSSLQAHAVVGTDGSPSVIRNTMVENGISSFELEYLEYGYKKLTIPPGPNGKHSIEKNALHVWPRKRFMLSALPNIDGSFSCTLFLPHNGEVSFESLTTADEVRVFFLRHFPDIAPLMPDMTREFLENPTGSMMTVKGSPWHVEDKALLIGDAAHALVPFFGQGMNSSFEDCSHVNRLVQRQMSYGRTPEKIDWREVFADFSKTRKKETDAIADLAVEDFVEMRDACALPKFQLKKRVEHSLEENYPGLFVPKYTMVALRRIPYSVARARSIVQEQILNELCEHISRPEDLDLRKADLLISKQLNYIE